MSRRLKLRPVFDERTGDPSLDARARRENKTLRRLARDAKIRTAHGRRRKKRILTVEGHRYMQIINAAAQHVHEKRIAAGAAARPMGRETDRPKTAPVPRRRGLLNR